MNNEEQKYLDLLKRILDTGSKRKDRTGVGTIGLFGETLRFSLKDNTIPIITTKKVFTRGVIEETLFFIRGETDTKKLEEKNVNIWKGNTSRDFLNKRGLSYLPEGNLGKMYGFQWRNFGGEYGARNGVDQLKNAFDLIKNDPYSRRILVSAYNPKQSKDMVLEPCHYSFQFYVDGNELSILYNQRSCDTFLGIPFNFMSYSLICHLMAKATGLKAKELIFCGGDVHIYQNHIDAVKEQLTREPHPFPKLNIKKDINSIEDMEKLSFEDFEIIDYKSHPAIKAEMAI